MNAFFQSIQSINKTVLKPTLVQHTTPVCTVANICDGGFMSSQPSNHALYEAMKSAWIALHPDSTPAEYEAAMKRLAKECGI